MGNENGQLAPISGVSIFRQDVVVWRGSRTAYPGPHVRGDITEFSLRSRQRLAFVACNTPVDFNIMLTLTYPKEYPCNGATVKTHFRAFCQFVRRDSLCPNYLWFLEFQQRGAPHFHILLDAYIPRTKAAMSDLRFRVACAWYRIVASGDTKHLAAGTRVERIRKLDGAKRYACKYAFKMYQKQVPVGYRDVGRFWGCSRGVVPVASAQVQVCEDDVLAVLDGWKYLPRKGKPLYRVLYGTADRFREYMGTG